MTFKNVKPLVNSLNRKSDPYYSDLSWDDYLSGFGWGDANYDEERSKAFKVLTENGGLNPNQANDVLDAFITKFSHYKPTKLQKNFRSKVGKFETGNNWEETQKAAQKMLDENPDASGVLYGLRYEDEKPQSNNGLKNPMLFYGNELNDIVKSLTYGKKMQRFQFDTLFNQKEK